MHKNLEMNKIVWTLGCSLLAIACFKLQFSSTNIFFFTLFEFSLTMIVCDLTLSSCLSC